MTSTTRKIYGYLVFRKMDTNEEIHRMAVHSPEDSRTTERVMDGVDRQIAEDVYYEWENA